MLNFIKLRNDRFFPSSIVHPKRVHGNPRAKIDIFLTRFVVNDRTVAVGQEQIKAGVGVCYVLFVDLLYIHISP